MAELADDDWLETNRAQWDERVPLHLASDFYDLTALRDGRGELYPIEEAGLSRRFPEGLEGLRVLHLQCHFGADSLVLAQRGATVVGVDFSKPAVKAARELATSVGLSDRSRFIEANVYDLRHILPEPESFDLVYTTWGTIGWLPDVAEWARLIEWYLKPGGALYFADTHPGAWVFDDAGEEMPGWAYPYDSGAITEESGEDYADSEVKVHNTRSVEWLHPLGETIGGLLAAGLTLESFEEHFEVPFRMYRQLVPKPGRMFGWPDRNWLPLSLSVVAKKA